jgi:hypothetical protein
MGKVVIHLQKHGCSTSINSKWIKNLNIRPETLRSVQESREYTGSSSIGKDFLSRTKVAQQLREKMDKWDYMKLLKSFFTTKEMASRLKGLPTKWEKIFASYTSDKGLITKIYRELKKLNSPPPK